MAAADHEPATKADIARLDAKIGGLDLKVAGLDSKVAGLDSKVAGLDSKVAGLDSKVAGLDSKVGKLEGAVNRIAIDQVNMRGEMRAMGDRLADLIRGESVKTLEHIDAFADKLDRYERESHTLPKTLDEHGKTLRDHEQRIKVIEGSRAG